MKLMSVVGGLSGRPSGKLSVRVSSQRKIAAITACSVRLFSRCYCERIRAETRRHARRILTECINGDTLVGRRADVSRYGYLRKAGWAKPARAERIGVGSSRAMAFRSGKLAAPDM